MLKRGLWRESAVATTAGGSAVFTWTAVLRRGILIGDWLSTVVVVPASDNEESGVVASVVEGLTVRLRGDAFAGMRAEGEASDPARDAAGADSAAAASGVLFPADRERVVLGRRVRVGAAAFFPGDDFFDFIKFGPS
jgi:hypothetical protein